MSHPGEVHDPAAAPPVPGVPTVTELLGVHGGDAVRVNLGLSVRWVARVSRVTPEFVRAYEQAKARGAPIVHPRLDALYTALAAAWQAVQ